MVINMYLYLESPANMKLNIVIKFTKGFSDRLSPPPTPPTVYPYPDTLTGAVLGL